MSSRAMQTALLIFSVALMSAALRAQPVPEVAVLKQVAAPLHSALDVPIIEIAASLRGRDILDKDFPGLRKHAMYGVFNAMTLNQIAAMSHGEITPDMLVQARTDLSALPFKPAASVPQTEIDDPNPAPSGSQTPLSDSYPK
jgi:hypothetical protein